MGTNGCLAVTPPVNTPLNGLDACLVTGGGAVKSKALLSFAAFTSLADLAVAGFIFAKFFASITKLETAFCAERENNLFVDLRELGSEGAAAATGPVLAGGGGGVHISAERCVGGSGYDPVCV